MSMILYFRVKSIIAWGGGEGGGVGIFFKRLAAKLEKQFIKTSNVDLVSNLIILLTLRAFVSQNNVLLSNSRDFRVFKSI